jgi:RimJ/RimL family protein N-acetyltransferase
MRELRSARLVLEPQLEAHAEAMFDVLSDPAIYEYENEPPQSLAWLCKRFRKLESRSSADGSQQWLNWVVRFGDDAIGYVQATVHREGRADIAYVFASRFWGRGFAREAVEAMLQELRERYGVRSAAAVFKAANHRSRRLLEGLRFTTTTGDIEPDEEVMQGALQ